MPAGRLLIGLAVWWRTTYRPGGQFSARSFESVAILASHVERNWNQILANLQAIYALKDLV